MSCHDEIILSSLVIVFIPCSDCSTIPVSQKKRNGRFLVPCNLKVSYFTSLNKASSAEENDTKIIEFGWVILILCPFLETQSFSNFAWFLRPMIKELCREWPFIWCLGKRIDPCQQKKQCTVSVKWAYVTLFRSIGFHMKGHSYERPFLVQFYAHQSQKSSEIWKILYFKKWA